MLVALENLQAPGGGRPHGPAKKIDRSQYQEMLERIRRVVASTLPANATIAVVSKGDPELVHFEGRRGLHFPQQHDGKYAGFHPPDSAAAMEQLSRVQAKGAEFLLFPATAFWWLDHYKEFAAHLGSRGRVLVREEESCVIFALPAKSISAPSVASAGGPACAAFLRQLRGVIDSVLPPEAKVVVMSDGDAGLLDFENRVVLPFSQGAKGTATRDGAGAIAQLEKLKKRGAHFFVVPKTASSWFDQLPEFGRHLETNYRAIVRQRHVCTIFDLNGR
jgi:hypothetical protein